MISNIDAIKKQRLAELLYFKTIEEAKAYAKNNSSKNNKIFGFFKISKDGKELFTLSYSRDWELLLRNGFTKIEGIRY